MGRLSVGRFSRLRSIPILDRDANAEMQRRDDRLGGTPRGRLMISLAQPDVQSAPHAVSYLQH